MKHRILFTLLSFIFMVSIGCINTNAETPSSSATQTEYQCIPCGSDCDKIILKEAGKCAHCNMELVKKSTIAFKTIQPDEICQYITEHPDIILIDVRTKQEYEGTANPNFGTLKNAINIPIQTLDKELDRISKYKDKEIIVFCSHSHRSPRAAYILGQHGFSNVTNMAGGMSAMNDKNCIK